MVLSRTFLSAALVLLLAVVQRCSAGIDEEQKEPWQINYLTLFGEKNSHFGQRIFFIFKDSNPGHEVEKICAHYSPPGGSVEDSTVLISCTQDAKQFFQQGQQPVRSQPGQADQPAEEVIFGFDGSSVEIFRIFTPHDSADQIRASATAGPISFNSPLFQNGVPVRLASQVSIKLLMTSGVA